MTVPDHQCSPTPISLNYGLERPTHGSAYLPGTFPSPKFGRNVETFVKDELLLRALLPHVPLKLAYTPIFGVYEGLATLGQVLYQLPH